MTGICDLSSLRMDRWQFRCFSQRLCDRPFRLMRQRLVSSATVALQDDEALLSPGYLVNGEYEIQSISERRSPWIAYRAQHKTRKSDQFRVFTLSDFSVDSRYIDAIARYGVWLKSARLPGMPGFVDAGVEQGFSLVITEWVEGPTLAAYLQGSPKITPDEALQWLRSIAEQLDVMHAQRPALVHQLLSPHTILLEGATRQPRLVEIGFAHCLRSAKLPDVALHAKIEGLFVAPEDVATKAPSASVDRYALGKLAELLLSPIAAQSAIEKVIQRATAQSVMTRFVSCAGFVQALALALRGAKPTSPSANNSAINIASPVAAPESPASVHDAPTRQVLAPASDPSLSDDLLPLSEKSPSAPAPIPASASTPEPKRAQAPTQAGSAVQTTSPPLVAKPAVLAAKPTPPKQPPKTLVGLGSFKDVQLPVAKESLEPQLEVSDSWADIDQLDFDPLDQARGAIGDDDALLHLIDDDDGPEVDLAEVFPAQELAPVLAAAPKVSAERSPIPQSVPVLDDQEDDVVLSTDDDSELDELSDIGDPRSVVALADVTPVVEKAATPSQQSAAVVSTPADDDLPLIVQTESIAPPSLELDVSTESPAANLFGQKESVAEVDQFEREFGLSAENSSAKVIDVPPLFEVAVPPPQPIDPVVPSGKKSSAQKTAVKLLTPMVLLVSVSGLVIGAAGMIAVDREFGYFHSSGSRQNPNARGVLVVPADASLVEDIVLQPQPEPQPAVIARDTGASRLIELDIPSSSQIIAIAEPDVPMLALPEPTEDVSAVMPDEPEPTTIDPDGPALVPGPSGLSGPDWHIRAAARRVVRTVVEPCGHGAHHVARIFVRFTGATGAIDTVSVVGSAFQNTPLGACVEQAMRRVQLPVFRDAHWDTDYAVTLR